MGKLTIVEGVASKKHHFYGTWSNMRDRCNNPNNKDYKYYGAKNIIVCSRWDSFASFVIDIKILGNRPKDYTLDRIDSNGNYAITNCKWSSKSEQANNQKIRCTNTSGYKGINPHKDGGFMARKTIKGSRKYIGYFKTLDEAIAAMEKKENAY